MSDAGFQSFLQAKQDAQAAEMLEYYNFSTSVELSIRDLKIILGKIVTPDLHAKLSSALAEAERNYHMRNVDFGDFKDDT